MRLGICVDRRFFAAAMAAARTANGAAFFSTAAKVAV
jgi:hypothetical protein